MPLLTRPLRALCAAALLAAASLAHAQIDRSAAESLLRKSGLWEQLAGVGAEVEAGVQQVMAQAGHAPAASEQARVARAVQEAYAPARLRSVSTGVIASGMKPEHLAALQRWFDSPVGQAITRAEEAQMSGKGDSRAALQEGVALLKAMPAQRRALLEQLLDATGAAEAMARMTISTAVAAQVGAASAMPGAPAPSAAQVRAALEAQRPQLVQGLTGMMLASFAQAYAGIPSAQMKQYVAFIRTPAGTQFNTIALEALEAALVDGAAEMGRRLPGTSDNRNS